ncbi:hypothetical protein OA492_01025 [Pelagibacteraceae bacterium]|nr:hypothetical protein [Pelagibacteraceae bacterium]
MNSKEPKIDDELFLSKKAAWLYYVAKLNQNQIAENIGLSKMRVHRLIALAEKNGFVKTYVEGDFERTSKYENILKEKYKIKFCEVIPNDLESDNPINMLGAAGGRFIMKQINNNIYEFGIGTGSTMSAVAKWLPKINKKIDFISLNGSLTSNNAVQTQSVISQIANKTEGHCYATGIPLITESIEQKKMIENINYVKKILIRANKTKIKILGVGGLDDSSLNVRSKIFSEKSIENLKRSGAVGEVGGNFFDIDGKIVSNEETAKILSANYLFFKKAKTVLIAGGKNKILQLKSVLKSANFSGLITDSNTADRLT